MKDPIRLSKLMADTGICSRREADQCIENGWVKVNGEVVSELGSKVDPDATLTLSPEAEAWLRAKISIVLYKPVGYVSGQAEEDYTPASFLITEENQVRSPGDPETPERRDLMTLAPAGRLDIDSRGLLLLSQDGKLVRKIIAPDSEMDKEYLVWVEGRITEAKLRQLRHGLSLDGKPLKPAIVEQVKDQQLRFILREGKKRQIRRVCEMMELEVTSLVRVRIGPLKLGNLEPSQWRYLSRNEHFSLMHAETEKTEPTVRVRADNDDGRFGKKEIAKPAKFSARTESGFKRNSNRDSRPTSRPTPRPTSEKSSTSSRPVPRTDWESKPYVPPERPERSEKSFSKPTFERSERSPNSKDRNFERSERPPRATTRYEREMRAMGIDPNKAPKVPSGKKKNPFKKEKSDFKPAFKMEPKELLKPKAFEPKTKKAKLSATKRIPAGQKPSLRKSSERAPGRSSERSSERSTGQYADKKSAPKRSAYDFDED